LKARPYFRRTAVFALGLALVASACRRAPKKPDRTAPWPASASPSASGAPLLRRLHYALQNGDVSFELPARHGNPQGKLPHARGELDVDLDDLSRTTGSISFELGALVVTSGDGHTDAANTARALAWLELGNAVAADQRARADAASFVIGSLDAGHLVTAPNGDRRVPRRELESRWTVRGELSLHGVRAPVSAEVSLSLVPGTDPTGPPVELVIRSRRPLVVSLGTHDIRPRDESGVPIAKDLALFGDRVGTEAKISFELVFVPH
jgi:hypothetical protein